MVPGIYKVRTRDSQYYNWASTRFFADNKGAVICLLESIMVSFWRNYAILASLCSLTD